MSANQEDHLLALSLDDAQRALAIRLVRGACGGDQVRLHGAIFAVLELYPGEASVGIFATALRWIETLQGHDCREQVARTIRDHAAHHERLRGAD